MARTRRWSVALMALLALMFAFALTPTQALAKTGWVKDSKGWRYYASDTEYYKERKTTDSISGLYKIDGKWYGFDANGYMKTGWFKTWDQYTWDDETYEYTDWFYMGKDGAAVKGWQKISGKWYYFANDGDYPPYMYSDDVWTINGKHYAFDKNGAMVANKWVKTDWDSVRWFYANSDGTLARGWKMIGGSWYFFENGTYKDSSGNSHPYYPVMYSGGMHMIGNDLYYFTSSGAMKTGWQKGLYTWIDDSGTEHEGVDWYYFKSSGAAAKGWQKVGGKWYYFFFQKHDESGWSYYMYSDGLYEIGGKSYYFNKGGDMAVGWKQLGGQWYYFESSGAMATSKWVGNYYLKEDGSMAVNEWIGKYHVNGSGKWDQTK